MAQIAAEVLELPLTHITVSLGDTASGPACPPSGGSLTAPSVAPAVKNAAERLKWRLLRVAAAHWDTETSQLSYHTGAVQWRGQSKTIAELMELMRETTLFVQGYRRANPQGFAVNTFGVQFAQVLVDTYTGNIAVERITAAHDIGRVLNPLTCENQVHGGIVQGLGMALMEERVMDHRRGIMLNPHLIDYKMPTMMDIPRIDVHFVNRSDNRLSDAGVKGVGEPAMIPTPAAIANAVSHALGRRVTSLPMTPDRILELIQQKGDAP
jgi:xanthine dehydrogenase YagR molybdenum-binding subunit